MELRSSSKAKRTRWIQTAFVASGIAALGVGGCDSSVDEKKRAAELAGGCAIASDCADPLICAFQRCHLPCKEDRDCEAALRCVKSETKGVYVCQLDEETTCKVDKDCPGEQTCAVDEECRDSCSAKDECTATQVCATSGVCASTVSRKDHVAADGSLVPSGADGSGGAAGAPQIAGASSTGGSSPSESEGGAAGASSSSTGSDAGAAGSGAAAGDGAVADFVETNDGVETVNNDDRQHAIWVTKSAYLHLANGQSEDWLSFHAPDDGHAHVISVHIEQEQALASLITVYAEVDFTPISKLTSLGTGTQRDLYVTVGAGSTTLFQLAALGVSGSSGMALVTFTDAPEDDDNEPNNSKAAATAIALDQTVSGQVLNPWVAQNNRPNQDWFKLELGQGTATFALTSVPSEGRLQVVYINPNGASTALAAPSAGAIASYPLTLTMAGTYYFELIPYLEDAYISGYSFNTKPSYLDEQYSFTVSQ
jgi:hypothetical protein